MLYSLVQTRSAAKAKDHQVGAGDPPWTPEAILEQPRDHDGHPNSVCRHPDPARGPDQAYHTVTSVLMDLTAGRMWISDGPPYEAGYQALGLG